MASFNPDIKDVQPVNPIGWSKPGVVPEKFASATEASIKGAGQLVGDVVKASDELIKQDAQKAVEDKVNPVRDDYISQLSAADFSLNLNQATGGVNQGIVPSAKPLTPGVIEMGSNDEPTQAELKTLPNSLSLLESAKANGKLSPTAYYGRLMSIAQDLRSRYPVGYREYIDKEISKVTGVDPANAYIHSILGDINSFMTNHQAEKGKVLSEMMKYVGADPQLGTQMYKGVANGSIPLDKGLAWAAQYAAIDYQHQQRTAKFQDAKQGNEYNKSEATMGFQTWTSDQVAAQFDSVITLQGQSPQSIQKIMLDSLNGKTTLGPNDYQLLAQNMRGLRDGLAAKMFSELNKTDERRPYSYARTLGGDGNKIIEESLAPYNRVIDALDKKDIGLAYDAHKSVQAFKDQSANLMWKQPSFAAWAGQMEAFRQVGGDQAVTKLMERQMGLNKLPVMDQKFIETNLANLSTGPDPRGRDFKNVNNVYEAVKTTADAERKLGRKIPESYREIQNQIDGPNLSLLDPSTPIEVKKNIARNYFSPETNSFLGLIKPDVTDPKTGLVASGRQSWFARFTRPDVAQQIKMLGDPQIQADYNDWVKTNYESLFGEDIKKLGNIDLTNTKWHLSWNDEDPNRRLHLATENRDTMIRNTGRRTLPYEDEVAKINKGITGMANVLKAQGKSDADVKAAVLNSLQLQLSSWKSFNGVPEGFIKGLEEQARLTKEEEAKKKETNKKYAP